MYTFGPNSSSRAKRYHCGVNSVPPQKMPLMPASSMLEPFVDQPHGEGFEQLGRGEHALDVVAGGEDRDRLIDHVVAVLLDLGDFAFLQAA